MSRWITKSEKHHRNTGKCTSPQSSHCSSTADSPGTHTLLTCSRGMLSEVFTSLLYVTAEETLDLQSPLFHWIAGPQTEDAHVLKWQFQRHQSLVQFQCKDTPHLIARILEGMEVKDPNQTRHQWRNTVEREAAHTASMDLQPVSCNDLR